MEPVEEIEFEYGVKVKVYYDDHDMNPRTNQDNASTMLCAHSRYDLGDEQVRDEDAAIAHIAGEDGVTVVCENCGKEVEESYSQYYHIDDEDQEQELCGDKEIKPELKGVEIMPLFLIDHSGLSMSTSDFRDPWDSGQVGIIYLTHPQIKENFLVDEINDEVIEKARNLMKAEVSNYDDYLRGECYWYEIVDEDDQQLDSMGGFVGHDWLMEHIAEEVPSYVEEQRKMKESIQETLDSIREG